MIRVAILAAMPGELKPLVRNWLHEPEAGVEIWRWPHKKGEWVAACAGMGPEAVERAYEAVEARESIDMALSIGWAGALTPEFEGGEVCWLSGVVDVRTGIRYRVAHSTHERWLVSTSTVASCEQKISLAAGWGAELVDMEAATVARLARLHDIPFYCLKGVSDTVHDRLPDFNLFLSDEGQLRLGPFVAHALLRPRLWPALVRMGDNSRKAARLMAEVLTEFLNKPAGKS